MDFIYFIGIIQRRNFPISTFSFSIPVWLNPSPDAHICQRGLYLDLVWAAPSLGSHAHQLGELCSDKWAPQVHLSGHLPVTDLTGTSGCLAQTDLANLLSRHSLAGTVALSHGSTPIPALTSGCYNPASPGSPPDSVLSGCCDLDQLILYSLWLLLSPVSAGA